MNRLTWLIRKIKAYLKRERAFKGFKKEFEVLISGGNQRGFDLVFQKNLIMDERTVVTKYDRHYVLHLAWAARILKERQPKLHVDISSSLHFCTIMTAFMKVEFYDFRPAKIELSNLSSHHADLTNLQFQDNSLDSISCMHVVEHIGLGRYGDPIDYDGDLKSINELKRVLKPGGQLLFVTPLGQGQLIFNRHRVYSYDQIMDLFEGMELQEFTLIPEDGADGDLLVDPSKEILAKQTYGCGCWNFTKSA